MPALAARDVRVPDEVLQKAPDEYRWHVPRATGRDHQDGEYDVIVIGAGMGGLACAALLAKRGYRTLVLEHHSLVGGYYGSFERNGFRFNTGAVEISGLWEGGPIDLLLKDLGLSQRDFFTPNSYTYRLGPWQIEPFDCPGALIGQLAGLFPEESSGIASFFSDARRAHDEWFLDCGQYGIPLRPALMAELYGDERILPDMDRRPHYYDWLGKSWQEKLDEHVRSDGLKTLLDLILNYLQSEPASTRAEIALRSMGFVCHGSFFPKGGAQRLSNALRDFIQTHGGDVLVQHRVRAILTDESRVTGVRAGAKVFCGSVVVSDSCIKHTILDLLDPAAVEARYLSVVQDIRLQMSFGMVFLGSDLDLRHLPTIIRVPGGDVDQVVINSNADACYAPEGMTSITLIGPAGYQDYPPRGTPEYQARKEALAKRMIEQADDLIPGLAQHILVQDSATPRTLERYTLAPEGSGEGIVWSGKLPRPWFKTPIRGLYLVGSSADPGSGVDVAVMTGVVCANDIDGWKRGERSRSICR